MFKYNTRSISELYDQCSAIEWSELLYCADINLHKHLNISLEMYLKEVLDVQRQDRWMWFCKYAKYLPDEINELKMLFDAQNIDLTNFSNYIYDVLRCVDPKINCVRLVGVPNSGKTLIAQLIGSCFVSAYLNNHNSENEFYLSSCLNKAIGIFEELFVTTATAEDLKSILAGAKLDISKKYTAKQILIRTPIIVTSNHNLFGRGHLAPLDEKALSTRCYTVYFSAPYKPAITITLPALSYLIYESCDNINKNVLL